MAEVALEAFIADLSQRIIDLERRVRKLEKRLPRAGDASAVGFLMRDPDKPGERE